MTDNETFYHPKTGRLLHRVPVGATIPEGTPCGYESVKDFIWLGGGLLGDRTVGPDSVPHYTAEPIRPPMPPLPTEVGSLIRATVETGETYEVMVLTGYGEWWGVNQDGLTCYWWPSQIADWEPVRVVPAEEDRDD